MATDKVKQANYRKWGNVGRSILNGVIGDYLSQQQNPLAIEMGFYDQGVPLLTGEGWSYRPDMPLTNKVVVLLHGLTNLETIWDFSQSMPQGTGQSTGNDNYGLRLQHDFDYTPLFLRYNTGLSLEENGRQFADLMNRLVAVYPIDIDDLILLGFSMGGLLMRHAQKVASESEAPWLPKVSKCFYLGTPHEGSPVEKFGHLASSVVRAMPQDYISQWADWIDIRSEGIQDLRDGLRHLHDPETSPSCGSFSAGARHHFVSGSISKNRDSVLNKFLGDSLVKHNSANTESAPEGSLYSHFDGMPHVPLAHSRRVYREIKRWLALDESQVTLRRYVATAQGTLTDSKLSSQSNKDEATAQYRLMAGMLDLLTVAYEKSVDAIEGMHLSIAREPHAMLQKVPVVSPVSKVIDESSAEITEMVYRSVKMGGKLIDVASELVKRTAQLQVQTQANSSKD